MAMKRAIKNARKGVSGDRNMHHPHMQRRGSGVSSVIPLNRKPTLPYAAMQTHAVQSILNSGSPTSTLIAANPLSVAFAIRWEEEDQGEVEAAIAERPQPKLATDYGHDVRDDGDRYEAWLKEYAWTAKSRAKSVVSLLHPDDKKEFVPVLRNEAVTVHGIPIGNLRIKALEYQWVPTSWTHVKMQHMKNSAHSRRERVNNVHHTEVESATRTADFIRDVEASKRLHDREFVGPKPTQPLVVDAPPWSAANSSVYEETQVQDSFMDQVHILRKARQQRLRMEHFYRSSSFYSNGGQVTGFMDDVGNQMYARHLYNKRLAFVRAKLRRKALRAERRKQHEKEDRLLGRSQYRARQWEMYFLLQHGEKPDHRVGDTYRLDTEVVATISDVTEEQAKALEIFALEYPAHLNRDFWKQETEAEHPDFNRTVTSAHIIQRAEVRVRRETAQREAELAKTLCQDSSPALRSWFKGHEHRKGSPFDAKWRANVIHRVAPPSQKRIVSEERQLSRRRVREERVLAIGEAVVTIHRRTQEDPHEQHVDLTEFAEQYSKLIRAGQADQRRVNTHRLLLGNAVEKLNMQFNEDHGLILPARLFDSNPVVASPAMH